MSKQYYQPHIEIYSITPLTVICVSGGENAGFGGNNEGEDPWTQGLSPKRTPAF